MYKVILLCALLLATSAVNVRKTHGAVHGHTKHHDKPLSSKAIFHSAFFELVNVGEADYQLDEKVAKHWADVTKDYAGEANSNTAFVEVEEEAKPGVIGEVVDLSSAAGVISYIVTDVDGNIMEAASGDKLAAEMKAATEEIFELNKKSAEATPETSLIQEDALVDDDKPLKRDVAFEKLKADMEQIKKDDQTAQSQFVQTSQEKGPAMAKLENDMDRILREDQEEAAAAEAEREQVLAGTVQQE